MNDLQLTDITGVILVGGKSRRMGQDKAFLELDGKPLIERLLLVFQECFSRTVLVGGSVERFSAYGVPVLVDIYPGSSLGGLYSGLCNAEDQHIFVASCDMVRPNPFVIRQICSLKSDYDAVVPIRSHGFEPLCALYSKSCLSVMKNQLKNGNFRILDLYPQLRIRPVPYDELVTLDADSNAFLSVNTPEEFEAIWKGKTLCP